MGKKKATHGGPREGSGRKPGDTPPKQPGSFRIAAEVKEYLDSTGQVSATIEAAIRRTAGFKAYQDAKKERG